jgi:hypothetical protein
MLDYSKLPGHIQGGVQRYIEKRIEPGSFLSAVICNDLREACAYADDINRHRLFDIVSWFYCEAPGNCWGSPEKFLAWLSEDQAAA